MQTITIKGSVLGKSGSRTLVVSETKRGDKKTLRPYQQEMLKHLSKNPHTLMESPTGSGKTTVMLCHAARCLKKKKKVIIISTMNLCNIWNIKTILILNTEHTDV